MNAPVRPARGRSTALTQRVVWALTGTVALFVAMLVLLAYLTFDQMEDSLVNDILATESDRVVQQIIKGDLDFQDAGPVALGQTMKVWRVRGEADRQQLPAVLRELKPGMHLYEDAGMVWHVSVRHVPDGLAVIYYDATENEARVDEFGLIVMLLGLACTLGAYLVARRVARLAVGPMLRLTHQLASWAPGAPDMTVDRDDEAGRLVEAFNRVQNRLEQTLAREREFSANLSHEIRTPLAAMRSDVEIMLLDPHLPGQDRMRLERTLRGIDSVVVALQAAQALAREEAGAAEPVALADCLHDAWGAQAAAAERAGLRLVDRVPPHVVVELDRYALLMVLRNLVRNAIDHAAPATLTVEAVDGGLDFRDNGPGIAPGDLPFVFERYYSAARRDVGSQAEPGALRRGLGLAIAKRVCDAQGWRLDVQASNDGPDRGTRFRLRFDVYSTQP
ncbi:HAMP domain-containing sensor histidine kinase [Orrella sp. JC864]|uniref:sensor histidine kinase n=1 Tax=Orrella sp. JC864 TaxID=3120298 RepID=UPI003008371A